MWPNIIQTQDFARNNSKKYIINGCHKIVAKPFAK